MTYNTSDTIYYRVAKKLQAQSQPILDRAEQDYTGLNIDPEKGVLNVQLHPEIFTYNSDPLKILESKKKATIPKKTKRTRGRRGNPTENGEGSPRVLRSRTRSSLKTDQETKVEDYKVKEVLDGRKLPKGWIFLSDEDEEEEEIIQEQVPPVNGIEYQVPIIDNDSVIATRTRSRKSSMSDIVKDEKDDEIPVGKFALEISDTKRFVCN